MPSICMYFLFMYICMSLCVQCMHVCIRVYVRTVTWRMEEAAIARQWHNKQRRNNGTRQATPRRVNK
jgi:hypothetical protein